MARGCALTNPAPTPGTGDVWREILLAHAGWMPETLWFDCDARRDLGIARYGVPLQRDNGRDHALDAYEEALDLLAYVHAGRAPWWLRWAAVGMLLGAWWWKRTTTPTEPA